MRLRAMMDEDFVNYKKPSMFLGTCFCNWKCCEELGKDSSMCQNMDLVNSPIIDIPFDVLHQRYIHNPITKAIVIGGLEPMDQFNEVLGLIKSFRFNLCFDDFVIYTGYKEEEIPDNIKALSAYSNIIVKFGRYIPKQESHFDEVLGIELASSNQYAKKIS